MIFGRFAPEAGVAPVLLPALLAAGVLADLVAAVYLLLPLTLISTFAPRRLLSARGGRLVAFAATAAVVFGWLYLLCTEYFFFEEFDSRFNLVAVDYLLYPQEVLINIRDSYPVTTVLALTLAGALAITALLRRFVPASTPPGRGLRARLATLACHSGLVVLLALTVSTHSFAHFDNRVANEIAINGTSSFFEALRTQQIDYHSNYRSADPAEMLALVAGHLSPDRGRFLDLESGSLDRRFAPAGMPRIADIGAAGPPNVVVVAEESFGAEFSGAYGADPSWTPSFDALSEHGLLFTHAYATGTRTVRGLEALSASLPPIPSVSIVKRPGSENIATWGGVMRDRGYHTSFLYGGFGYFDNMNHYFSGNGYAVSDRADIEDVTFANIWGVCDEDLFNHALGYFDQHAAAGQPFFSIVLSTSNHKPFTFPEGIPGIASEGGGREAGVRYADYALGRFFEAAKSHAWFDNTIFVFVADHGARVYGAAEIPLHTYEIPLLVIAPRLLAAGRVDTLISQIDVAPTVMHLIGQPYEAPFFGQDIFALEPGAERTMLFNHNHDVALLEGDELVVLGLHQSVTAYRVSPDRRTMVAMQPSRQTTNLAVAYFQTATDLFVEGRDR